MGLYESSDYQCGSRSEDVMRVFLITILVMLLAGCATIPECAEQADETARLLERAGVQSGVIWYRPYLSSVGHAVVWMNVDGETLYYDSTISSFVDSPQGMIGWVSEGPVER